MVPTGRERRGGLHAEMAQGQGGGSGRKRHRTVATVTLTADTNTISALGGRGGKEWRRGERGGASGLPNRLSSLLPFPFLPSRSIFTSLSLFFPFFLFLFSFFSLFRFFAFRLYLFFFSHSCFSVLPLYIAFSFFFSRTLFLLGGGFCFCLLSRDSVSYICSYLIRTHPRRL